jgi:hypothetical protein
MAKTRINISVDQDLADFAKGFAQENRVSVADMVTQYLLALKRRAEGKEGETILTHPAFARAMEEARSKLRKGTVKWHSYDEVFKD